MPFEDKSSHFIGAWTAHYTLADGTLKTFPVASYDLHTNLFNGGPTITVADMMANGCPSVHLASALLEVLDEGAHDFNVFIKQLAVLSPTDLQTLFDALYCRETKVLSGATDPLQRDCATTDERWEPTRRPWWQKCRCVFPLLHPRTKWYG